MSGARSGGLFLAFPAPKTFGAARKNFPTRKIGAVGLTDDRDANRFLTAAAITDPVEVSAINVLTFQLKQAGLWGKLLAIWPMVGGTAASCAQNLRSPLYTITWVNSPTFSLTGVTFNGSNNYGNTNLNPQLVGLQQGSSSSVYSRTSSIATGEALAALTTGPSNFRLIPRNTTSFSDIGFNVVSGATGANCLGLWSNRRSGALVHRLYKNGATVATGTALAQPVANTNLFLGASSNGGAPGTFMNFECAFCHVGTVLTDDENATLYNIVQNFQTFLGRQV